MTPAAGQCGCDAGAVASGQGGVAANPAPPYAASHRHRATRQACRAASHRYGACASVLACAAACHHHRAAGGGRQRAGGARNPDVATSRAGRLAAQEGDGAAGGGRVVRGAALHQHAGRAGGAAPATHVHVARLACGSTRRQRQAARRAGAGAARYHGNVTAGAGSAAGNADAAAGAQAPVAGREVQRAARAAAARHHFRAGQAVAAAVYRRAARNGNAAGGRGV